MIKMIANIDEAECIITLTDGSIWMINPGELSAAVCWQPSQKVKLTKAMLGSFFTHEMINEDNMDQRVLVRKRT